MNEGLRLIARWALYACALMVLPALFESVQVDSYWSALGAAALVSIFNALLRPLLIVLTLPVTVLTLGIFALVINGLLFWAVSGIVPGLMVAGFWSAFWAAIVFSILTTLADLALGIQRTQAHVRRY